MNRRSFLPLLSLFGLPLISRSVSAQSSGPLIYKAKLTQSGAGNPVADEIVNALGRDVSWVHWDSGTYIGAFSEPFSESAKVFCCAPVRDNAGDVTTGTPADFTMDGYYGGVQICAYGEGEDGLIGRREVEGALFVCFEIYQ